MDSMTLFFFVFGLGLLVLGAEVMVRGASRLAVAVGISPLVVGLTVVSFGTSSPELAVSVRSAWSGNANIAIGNIVGSNIFNVLVVLGLCAMIRSLRVSRQLVRLDVPIMIGAAILMLLLGLDGTVGRLDGLLLFAILVAYTVFAIWQSRKDTALAEADQPREDRATPRPVTRTVLHMVVNSALVVVGLGLLVTGSNWLVSSAVLIAETFGISSLVIGLTVVAAGTSLPEVATSVVATVRGERDMAVGNVVGSSIFNVFAILGLTALVAPTGIPVPLEAIQVDIPVMIGVAVICLPIFFTGFVVSRREGFFLLGSYVIYTSFLILNVTGHTALDMLRTPLLVGMLLAMLGLMLRGIRAAQVNLRDHGHILGEVTSR